MTWETTCFPQQIRVLTLSACGLFQISPQTLDTETTPGTTWMTKHRVMEAAAILRIPKSTIYHWIEEGWLKTETHDEMMYVTAETIKNILANGLVVTRVVYKARVA